MNSTHRLILLLLIVASFSGCTTDDPVNTGQNGGASDPDNETPSHLKPKTDAAALDEFMLDVDSGVRLVRITAQEDLKLNLTMANNRSPDVEVGATSACGSAEWTKTLSFQDGGGFAWTEGPGAMLRVQANGEEVQVPGGGGINVAVNLSMDYELTLNRTEQLLVRLSALDSADSEPTYRPSMFAESDGQAIVEELVPPSFSCSGRASGDSGFFLQSAAGPLVTAAVEGSVEATTENTTDARVAVLMDPRFAGACQVSILYQGEIVVADEQLNQHCGTAYEGAAGAYELRFDTATASGEVAWFIWA